MPKSKKPSRYIPDHLRQAVLQRDGYKCVKCSYHNIDYLEIDHKHPISKGGLTVFDNLQTLCGKCNSLKRDKTPECSNCGSFLVAGKIFCPSCGTQVIPEVQSQFEASEPVQGDGCLTLFSALFGQKTQGVQNSSSIPTKVDVSRGLRWIPKLVIVAAIIFMLWVVIAIAGKIVSSIRSFFSSNSVVVTSSAPAPVLQKNTTKIIDQLFNVDPQHHFPLQFTIPQGASGGRILGGFRVTEGAKVSVWILDQEEYPLWANGQSVRGQYQSGEKITAKIRRQLAPGTYYLIFQNASPDSISTIAAEFDIEY